MENSCLGKTFFFNSKKSLHMKKYLVILLTLALGTSAYSAINTYFDDYSGDGL